MDYDHEAKAKERKESDAQRKKRVAAAVSSVLASEDGRIVLAEILGYCQVEGINAQDGLAAGRVEGARAVGIRTINLLRESDGAAFLKLYAEIHLP